MFSLKKAFKQAQLDTDQDNQGELAIKIGMSGSALAALLYRNVPVLGKVEEIANKGFNMKLSEFIVLGEMYAYTVAELESEAEG